MFMIEPFMLVALGVGLLTACLCAYLGNFLLMKRMTFLSIALAETAALGVALGLSLHVEPSLSAFVLTLAAVVFFWSRMGRGRSTSEGTIGMVYVVSAAMGMLIVSRNPMVEAQGVDLVSGNMLYCTLGDVWTVGSVGALIALVHGVFRQRFLFVAFDRDTARAQGIRASGWDLALLVSIGLFVAVCISLVGVLFVFASLIIPGMAALVLCRRVGMAFVTSVVIAALAVVLGVMVSYQHDLPTSPTIICFYGVAFALAHVVRWLKLRIG